MKKEEFEALFDDIVKKSLLEMGFKEHGKSLYLISGENMISLIRLGGRMSSAGCISHVLCFRHTFLPNTDEKIPVGFESGVSSYPLKLKPTQVKGIFGRKIRYKSKNLSYEKEQFCFENEDRKVVFKYLNKILSGIITLVDWASHNHPEILEKEIKKYGEDAWIEKLWLDAYMNYRLNK